MVNYPLRKNRKDFIGRLAGNVTRALQDFPEIEIHPKHDRMHIVLNGAPFETIDQRLKLVLVFKHILQL